MADKDTSSDNKKRGNLDPITIRFPHDTAELLRRFAQENNCSLAELVRCSFQMRLTDYLKNIRFMDYEQGDQILKETQDLIRQLGQIEYELKRIGLNLNQVAKRLNENISRCESIRGEDIVKAIEAMQREQNKRMDQYESATKEVGEAICRILG